MIMQNATHQKNTDRIQAHSQMEIREFRSGEDARNYLADKLEDKLAQELKKEEVETVNEMANTTMKTTF